MDPSPIYLQLRDAIATVSPVAHGLGPTPELPRTWGVMVDVGLPPGPVTIVAIADGTTSLYQGNGGATVGAGAVPAVAAAARALLVASEDIVDRLPVEWRYPVPPAGWVQLIALTYAGMRVARVPMSELSDPRHLLHDLWSRAGDLVAAIMALPPG